MPRQPKPWRRGGTKGPWYAQIKGKQEWLAPPEASKAEAHESLLRLRTTPPKEEKRPRPAAVTFRECASEFVSATRAAVERGERKPLTLEGYERFLGSAVKAFGRQPVASMKPLHVAQWLDAPRGKPWNTTTRNNAVTAVKACLNWAQRHGLVAENPVRDMQKPPARKADADLTADAARAMIAGALDEPLRDFMLVMFGTGARPSEAIALEARHLRLDAGIAVMDGKTTGRTGRPRVIQIDAVADVLRRLAEANPEGPLLRNAKGTAWTRHSLAHRFKRLRRRLGLGAEATAKGFRHGFATDGLEANVPIATVAALLGHVGTKMVEQHYSKLHVRFTHLSDAAKTIRPGLGDAPPVSDQARRSNPASPPASGPREGSARPGPGEPGSSRGKP